MQIIVFKLDDKVYAIETGTVEEITKRVTSTKVPNAPEWVDGLINLRGNVITLLNLSKLLHQQDSVCYNNIIIIRNKEEMVGLMVEEVIQVMEISSGDIQRISNDNKDGIVGIIHLENMIINIIGMEDLFKNQN